MVKTSWANSTEEHLIKVVKAEIRETDEMNSENEYEVTEMLKQSEKIRNEDCCHWSSSKGQDAEWRLLPLKLKQMKITQEGPMQIPN